MAFSCHSSWTICGFMPSFFYKLGMTYSWKIYVSFLNKVCHFIFLKHVFQPHTWLWSWFDTEFWEEYISLSYWSHWLTAVIGIDFERPYIMGVLFYRLPVWDPWNSSSPTLCFFFRLSIDFILEMIQPDDLSLGFAPKTP